MKPYILLANLQEQRLGRKTSQTYPQLCHHARRNLRRGQRDRANAMPHLANSGKCHEEPYPDFEKTLDAQLEQPTAVSEMKLRQCRSGPHLSASIRLF
jgi:hypothetical protein